MLLSLAGTTVETARPPQTAHVVVIGNEKGGCGKSTVAIHLATALLKGGWRVATVDTDGRQASLTRYLENRARTAQRLGRSFEMPAHFVVPLGSGERMAEIEEREFQAFACAVDEIGERFDYLVIDTPALNSHLTRLSHGMADTLVTPLNDSFVDLDVIGQVDPESLMVESIGPYADLVLAARLQRMAVDGRGIDWVVVRNRLWALGGRNQQRLGAALSRLGERLGFRVGGGVSERLAFRELFPSGLTVLDALDRKVFGFEPTMSHVAGRREIRELVATLRLPRAGRRAAANANPAPVAAIPAA